ncbi:NADPH-dependent F420 reductase [Streptomyces chartreusis]|uniref:NADPH-dependent F420 reductase n=1 Tax=Streptomyces chartreusis TaxID=1969 RepID=UPI0036A084A2
MAVLGIIGSGSIGTALARLAIAAGIDVVLANSRGPHSLSDLVANLGPSARAGTPVEAAEAGDWVVSAIPLKNYFALPAAQLVGKVVLDTGNYYPERDGRIAVLDSERSTTTELVQDYLAGAKVVKAFNNIVARHIPLLARSAGAHDRTAVPIAGNDAHARVFAAALIDDLGFDVVDAGLLAEGWRFEPETAAYVAPYTALSRVPGGLPSDPAALTAALVKEIPTDPGSPLSAAELQSLLAEARPTVHRSLTGSSDQRRTRASDIHEGNRLVRIRRTGSPAADRAARSARRAG